MQRNGGIGAVLMRGVRQLGLLGAPVFLVLGVCSSPALASGWSVQNTANPAGGSATLSGVSCFSADACIAVGLDVKSDGRNGPFAERWNGNQWVLQWTPHPSGATVSYLSAVSCPLRRVCVAVGTSDGTRMLAERWNGARWSIQRTPSPRGGAKFLQATGVSCSSARACTAVGTYVHHGDRRLAERWNGVRWTIQRTPRKEDSFLRGVSCSSSRVCTAVGVAYRPSGREVPLAERWNGAKWTIQASSIPMVSVSCTSVGACTAVGGGFAERWDGTKWSIQSTPTPQFGSLGSVSCASRRACVAVGTTRRSAGPTRPPVPQHHPGGALERHQMVAPANAQPRPLREWTGQRLLPISVGLHRRGVLLR